MVSKMRGISFNLLSEIAEQYGTPTYVYFEEELVKCLRLFKEIFYKHFKNGLVAYAYKANSNPTICKIVLESGIGAEVVSGGELALALRLGVPSDMIVFDGVSKSYEELELAVKSRIFIVNAESLSELTKLSKVASSLNTTINVGLRLNVEVEVMTHRKVMTASSQDKFGIDYRRAIESFRFALSLPNLRPIGLHMHLGSQISKLEDFIRGLKRIVDIAKMIRSRLNYSIEVIDIGGGYPYPYDRSFDEWLFIDQLFKVMSQEFKEFIEELGLGRFLVVSEPGRVLLASSGVLLTRVNHIKESFGRNWILIDAGMNDFMRPALYEARHRISTINGGKGGTQIYNIAGPVCESSDVLAYDVELPKVKEGDLLAIWDVGAYGYSMSSNYNMRPRPAEVLVTRGCEVKLIRRRETLDDLLRGCEPIA